MTRYQSIDDLIPQKDPFVLVDKLISCENNIIISRFKIPKKHPLVHNGRLSEGGLTENIAQTAAAGNGFEAFENGAEIPKGFIAGIKNLKFEQLPLSESQIETKVYQLGKVLDYNLIKGEIFLEGELISSCEMKIYVPQ